MESLELSFISSQHHNTVRKGLEDVTKGTFMTARLLRMQTAAQNHKYLVL